MIKDKSIETLRGVAIISIVIFHVIGRNSHNGLQFAGNSFWQYFNYSFKYLRLPLFSTISGFVYALKPVQHGDFVKFLKGKSRRILLPFFFVSSLQYLANATIPNVNTIVSLQQMWKIYIFPYGQFWFLQSLFLIFIVVIILEKFDFICYFRRWGLIFLSAIFLLISINSRYNFKIFNLSEALYLFPFFLLGIGLQRFPEKIFIKPLLVLFVLAFILGIILQQLNWFGLVDLEQQHHGLTSIIVGISGMYLFFHFRKANNSLAKIGYFAYSIYLFHIFGTAGSRIMLQHFGIEDPLSLFICGVAAGIMIPIMVEVAISKNIISRRLFLGLK